MTIVRLSVGSAPVRLVSVVHGTDIAELRALICAAFAIPTAPDTAPVALIASDTGVLVPLSVACAHPGCLTAPAYGVLCVGGELRQDADAGAPAPQELAGVPRAVSDGVVRQVPADRVRAPAPADPAPRAPGAGEDAAVAKLVHLIVKFSKLLETSGRLSEREAAVVSGLAERRDTVVLAAYTVAATAQDAEYLADLVRGVAADFLSVKTEDPSSFDGPAEHDTAARLLHAIDEMFCRNLLDMDKCRYLQTLVLYKDPAVFAAFDVFADDEDVDELFDTLLHVAARDDGGDGGGGGDDDDDDDDESGDDGAVAPAPQNARYLQSPDRAAGPGRSVATETIPEGDEESASSDDDDDEPEELQLFRGAICREVDDLLTAGQLPAVAAKAVLVALQNEGLEEATSIDVALCRLARAAYDVYSIDGDRGELRNALLDACSAYGAAAGAAPAPAAAAAADEAEGPSLAGVDAEAKLNVLRECIAWLMNSGTIDESHAKALLRLTLEDDARVNGALEAYGRGGALEDFLASLAALAKHGAAAADRPPPPPAAAGPAAAAAPPAPPAEADVALKAADPAGAEAPDAEALRELSELIACLVDDGKLAGEELAHLERLVASRDARLLAAYDVYVDGQDVDDLVDTVMRVAKRERKLSNPPPVEANPGDAPPQPAKGHDFASVFGDIAAECLNDVEAAALQLCVARKDPDLSAVLEVYRVTGDKLDLQDSLKRVARKTIDATIAAGIPEEGEAAETDPAR